MKKITVTTPITILDYREFDKKKWEFIGKWLLGEHATNYTLFQIKIKHEKDEVILDIGGLFTTIDGQTFMEIQDPYL